MYAILAVASITSRSSVKTRPRWSAAAANTTPHTAMNAKQMKKVTYIASSARFDSPAPRRFPTRMVDAIATANGSDKNASVASCSMVRCASRATVPRYPARSVVISKLHASMRSMTAPGPASFQKPRVNFNSLSRRRSHRLGRVDASRCLHHAAYAIADSSWNHRQALVAIGAPLNPMFAGPKMRIQLRMTLKTLATMPMYTGGARMCCDCRYLVYTWNQ
mmetsp:Transcript_682/g.2560  ORF Transcript_682/g.2560 Transcript_682/m.2560 type:complete len:220 (+) Transcript_682:1595-2254(+)